jgi:hypothetical protein
MECFSCGKNLEELDDFNDELSVGAYGKCCSCHQLDVLRENENAHPEPELVSHDHFYHGKRYVGYSCREIEEILPDFFESGGGYCDED